MYQFCWALLLRELVENDVIAQNILNDDSQNVYYNGSDSPFYD